MANEGLKGIPALLAGILERVRGIGGSRTYDFGSGDVTERNRMINDFVDPRPSSPLATPTPSPGPTSFPQPTATPTPQMAMASAQRQQPVQQPMQQMAQQGFPDVTGYSIPQPNQAIQQAIMQNFPQDQWENAARVAFGESSYNPGAAGSSNDLGLFQVVPRFHRPLMQQMGITEQDLFDPQINAAVAAQIQGRQGWRPWYAAQPLGLWDK